MNIHFYSLIYALEQLRLQQQKVAQIAASLAVYAVPVQRLAREDAAQLRARLQANLLYSCLQDVATATAPDQVQDVLGYLRDYYQPAFIDA